MGSSLILFLALQLDPGALVPLYREALERREKMHGPDHPKVGAAARDLALYLRKQGDREQALIYLRRALAIDLKAYGASQIVVAEDREHIASLLAPIEAIVELTLAAQCSDPGTAARVLAKKAAITGARADYEMALAKQQEASGPDHPRVAIRLNDLALTLAPLEAEPLLRRALTTQRDALGVNHPETAVTLNNLANVLLATSRVEEAEKLQRAALTALEASLGKNHPRVATSCSNLADILRARKQYIEAKALYRRALSIDEKSNPEEVPVDLENLAGLLDELGEKKEAQTLRSRISGKPRSND